ncbi:hypothetical protein CONPUDRAFT_120688 [Coniophora puteana RWD-64-598 SS2]|uniref:HMG box domain-containing protein n=1 Tax=Coniophora puteana (strain RWD-64-598) TaxID=741705 RepID=A0A5M3MTV2_CONPW|nr:uncharacterized protein CONPUDRAFT_120688 [Coniophora puteana RWD-64-598 SS2]EIW82589.1 hypothetical protein CONPUDRAFT_120688 [Coniophora puteana RWD-64-598 SS2]
MAAGPSRNVRPSVKTVQPPRPPNAWILYRSDKLKSLPPQEPGAPRRAQAEVSKLISDMWKNEEESIRLEYERLAETKKAEHQRRYPDYRFQPMRKEDKEKMREIRKQEKDRVKAEDKEARRQQSAPYQVPTPIPTPAHTPCYVITPVGPAPVAYTPHPYFSQYVPEARFGPGGPSPPLSAAASPTAPGSPDIEVAVPASPRPVLRTDLPSFNGQLIMTPAPPPTANDIHVDSQEEQPVASTSRAVDGTPTPDHPPPPSSTSGVLPTPEWTPGSNADGSLLLSPQNAEAYLGFEVPRLPDPNDWMQQMPPMPSFPATNPQDAASLNDSFQQALLTLTGATGVYGLSSLDPSMLTNFPSGELEVEVPIHGFPNFDISGDDGGFGGDDLFSGFDFSAFTAEQAQQLSVSPLDLDMSQAQMGTYHSEPQASEPTSEEIASLVRAPAEPEGGEMYVGQRQPSFFTAEVLKYINFDAMESGEPSEAPLQDPPQPSQEQTQQYAQPSSQYSHQPQLPPQQYQQQQCQPTSQEVRRPFTYTAYQPNPLNQIPTNVQRDVQSYPHKDQQRSGTYMPPAGAANLSRRVAGSWKPEFIAQTGFGEGQPDELQQPQLQHPQPSQAQVQVQGLPWYPTQ